MSVPGEDPYVLVIVQTPPVVNR